MSFARNNTSNRLERAPAHLRPLLTVFLRPGFKTAFLAYAKQVATTGGHHPSGIAAKSIAAVPSGNPEAVAGTATKTIATAAAAVAPRSPPRRAISLGYSNESTAASASAAAAATTAARAGGAHPWASGEAAEKRRQSTFGDLPPTSAVGILAVKQGGVAMNDSRARRSGGGAAAGGAGRKAGGGAKWRTHGRGNAMDLTLTSGTASGKPFGVSSRVGADPGETRSRMGEGDTHHLGFECCMKMWMSWNWGSLMFPWLLRFTLSQKKQYSFMLHYHCAVSLTGVYRASSVIRIV